jgi:hypothetical protein
MSKVNKCNLKTFFGYLFLDIGIEIKIKSSAKVLKITLNCSKKQGFLILEDKIIINKVILIFNQFNIIFH